MTDNKAFFAVFVLVFFLLLKSCVGAQDKDGALVVYTETRVGERAKERHAEERDLRRHPREVHIHACLYTGESLP